MTKSLIFPRCIGFVAAVWCAMGTMQAAVVSDPQVVSGPGRCIAQTNGINVRATGSVSEGNLNERADFQVLSNFAGFEAGTNIVRFTGDNQPDIKVSFGDGFVANSGLPVTNRSFYTSAENSIRVALPKPPASAGAFTLKIEFGDYDAAKDSFTVGARSVSTACFTLASVTDRLQSVESIEATFLNEKGKALGIQSVGSPKLTDPHSPTKRILFAFDASTGDSIAAISVKFNMLESAVEGLGPIFGLDDIGFTISAH